LLGVADSRHVVVVTDGRVNARFVDPDYRKRMEIDDIQSST
jgi:hypothetical protein